MEPRKYMVWIHRFRSTDLVIPCKVYNSNMEFKILLHQNNNMDYSVRWMSKFRKVITNTRNQNHQSIGSVIFNYTSGFVWMITSRANVPFHSLLPFKRQFRSCNGCNVLSCAGTLIYITVTFSLRHNKQFLRKLFISLFITINNSSFKYHNG